MKLYHYTSVTLAGAICNSELRGSNYRTQSSQWIGPAVWLTSSDESDGHGLLTGKPLSEEERDYLISIGQTPRNLETHTKTAIRIQLDSEKLEQWSLVETRPSGLIDYVHLSRDFLFEDQIWRKYMGLSCYYSVSDLSDAELIHHTIHTPTKESTWSLYFGRIHPELFEDISFQTAQGFQPYDFEIQGRQVYAYNGIHVVSPALLNDFRRVYPPRGKYDAPHAAVFCEKDDSRPTVYFQALGKVWGVDLQTYMPVPGNDGLPENVEVSTAWAKEHQQELLKLWPDAVASYKRFHP